MKPRRQSQNRFAVISFMASAFALSPAMLQAAVTLDGSDVFVVSGTPTGDLAIFGDLSVVKGIDFGIAVATPSQAAVQLNYFAGSEKAAKFDITDAAGTFQWRDNLVGTARDKMKLDANNLLSLYNSAGSAAGISLNGNNGQINLSGTGSGIYSGGTPVFTLGSSGNLVFGATRPFSITNTTASSSSTTGALTVSGGIGVAMDSWINGVRIGRGAGSQPANTAVGTGALSFNTAYYPNSAFGYNALYANTSGAFNSATGFNSLYRNTTGGDNSAVGHCSLSNNTTGGNNSATGSSSLICNTTGGNNSAFGYYALFSNTVGQSNIAIGSEAGRYRQNGTSLTDPENSIYIGAYAKGKDNNDNNSIVIGYGAVGEGANTTVIGNSNTTKTHLFGETSANSLKVAGATTLDGQVIISVPQGDISMGIYQ